MARRVLLRSLFVLLLVAVLSAPGVWARAAAAQEPPLPEPPDVGAHAAIVVDFPEGRILYSKNPHERMAPASLTKIMTSLLALEYGNASDRVTASVDDMVGESTMGLQSGEEQSLLDLVYGAMLPSGNDASMAIARHLGTTVGANINSNGAGPVERFAEMMNVRVAQLGLQDTHFVNPHGLDAEGHYSSAYDLASITWYALHIPQFNTVVAQTYYEAPGHALLNTNEMLTRYEGADGVKTGWTDGCGLCLVTSATRGNHRLIAVVLNAPQWWKDSSALLDYGFEKLAAAPADAGAELLSVRQTGVAEALLANPASALPLPEQLSQGGGAPSQAAPPPAADDSLVAPANVFGAAPAGGTVALQGSFSVSPPLWLWALALLVVSCLLGGLILNGRRRAMTTPGQGTLALSEVDRDTGASYPFDPLLVQPARILPSHPTGRRREPNLLITAEEGRRLHLERAIVLAEHGRHGSSMSEFLLALRKGGPLDIAELAERYQLCAGAFISLARAQVATGDLPGARRTLLHGNLVMPNEHSLRAALYRIGAEG